MITPQALIARMRAGAVARYRLVAVPGRPEELAQPGTDKRVSIVYGGLGSVRVRRQNGREWREHMEIKVEDSPDMAAELLRFLDPHFGPVMDGYKAASGIDMGRRSRDIPMV